MKLNISKKKYTCFRIIPNLGTILPTVPSAGGDYIIGEEQ